MSQHKVEDVSEVFSVGDPVFVKVINDGVRLRYALGKKMTLNFYSKCNSRNVTQRLIGVCLLCGPGKKMTLTPFQNPRLTMFDYGIETAIDKWPIVSDFVSVAHFLTIHYASRHLDVLFPRRSLLK